MTSHVAARQRPTVAPSAGCRYLHTDFVHSVLQEAYKNWVCSKTIPYYHEDTQLEPCPRYCELVENRCPYIKPHLLDTYAGEQTFICRGENMAASMSLSTSVDSDVDVSVGSCYSVGVDVNGSECECVCGGCVHINVEDSYIGVSVSLLVSYLHMVPSSSMSASVSLSVSASMAVSGRNRGNSSFVGLSR
ncbi:hypothetical protein LSH36_414g02013 [Paralvinella palmiformis]|uniref:Uncharacterized protein n=1 Tax=Paralvinella palmiformis TaxID=53620 RepID=A0AAD9JCI5_9ANNE|nr:hypothetical protein LSH36_414g02013 [Paralvinella palmiformis]